MDSERSLVWDLDAAPMRDLGNRIVSERLDQVTVHAEDPSSLQSLERLGYPLIPTVLNPALDRAPRAGCVLYPHLHLSVLPVREYAYVVTDEQVHAFGKATGDLNPVHFDDDIARGLGFERRISHGMIFNGWLSRMLGTEFPGEGTIYLRSNCIYLAPVYAGTPYVVRVSVPRHDQVRGTFRVVAQLSKVDGGIAVIAYADVVKKPG